MRDLRELVVLVTGGSRGIGRALCLELAEAGATVYTCARNNHGLGETVDLFDGNGHGALIAQTADVTRPDQISALIERIEENEGRIDALVNNAGVLGPRERIEDVDLDAWRHTLEVNLDGVFITTKASIPLLRASEAGLIVNLSSSVGREGRGTWGPYAVSKHGVEGLTDTLADELEEDGITVVSVNPEGTATEMRAEAYPDEDPDSIPDPRQVAGSLALLVRTLGIEQTARSFDCRSLFEYTDAEMELDPEELPHVSS